MWINIRENKVYTFGIDLHHDIMGSYHFSCFFAYWIERVKIYLKLPMWYHRTPSWFISKCGMNVMDTLLQHEYISHYGIFKPLVITLQVNIKIYLFFRISRFPIERGYYLELPKWYYREPSWFLLSNPWATRNNREKTLSDKTRFHPTAPGLLACQPLTQ